MTDLYYCPKTASTFFVVQKTHKEFTIAYTHIYDRISLDATNWRPGRIPYSFESEIDSAISRINGEPMYKLPMPLETLIYKLGEKCKEHRTCVYIPAFKEELKKNFTI